MSKIMDFKKYKVGAFEVVIQGEKFIEGHTDTEWVDFEGPVDIVPYFKFCITLRLNSAGSSYESIRFRNPEHTLAVMKDRQAILAEMLERGIYLG